MVESAAMPLRCVVVTPERALLDAEVEFVAIPMYDGELGVLPGRAPLIGRLGPGELRTRHGQETRRFFVDGGFAQVHDNVITVLTPRALKAEEIDPAAAEHALEAAKTAPGGPNERLKNEAKARAQLRLAHQVAEH
ncbi:MAG TPA: ATP synthase F1 subunit epsilon [Gemmataceae bacterium]|nr:ATP synthase F1 subunit epsilon [Gemmataceae bacterium]